MPRLLPVRSGLVFTVRILILPTSMNVMCAICRGHVSSSITHYLNYTNSHLIKYSLCDFDIKCAIGGLLSTLCYIDFASACMCAVVN